MPPIGILLPLIYAQTLPIWWRNGGLQCLTVPQQLGLTSLKRLWCVTLPHAAGLALIIGVCIAALNRESHVCICRDACSRFAMRCFCTTLFPFKVSAKCWKVEKRQRWAARGHKSSQTNPEFAKQKKVFSPRHISSTQHCGKGHHCSYMSGLTASTATPPPPKWIHLWGATTEVPPVADLCQITAIKRSYKSKSAACQWRRQWIVGTWASPSDPVVMSKTENPV